MKIRDGLIAVLATALISLLSVLLVFLRIKPLND